MWMLSLAPSKSRWALRSIFLIESPSARALLRPPAFGSTPVEERGCTVTGENGLIAISIERGADGKAMSVWDDANSITAAPVFRADEAVCADRQASLEVPDCAVPVSRAAR
jgi:hypothetical protein